MTIDPADPRRGRRLLLAGVGAAVLGVVGCVIQFAALKWLMVPWYMPAAAVVGALLVAASLKERRTLSRILSLIVVLLLGGAEITGLVAMRLPRYEGPMRTGRELPAFAARRADGSTFTQADLVGSKRHAMVFFRGRW